MAAQLGGCPTSLAKASYDAHCPLGQYRAHHGMAESAPSVALLQKRIEDLARESAKSLFLVDAFSAAWGGAHGAPSLPTEDAFFNQHD